MSMQEYHVKGVGFYTQDISGANLSKFLFRTHKDALNKIENYSLAVNLRDLSSELASSPELDEEKILDYVRDCTDTITYAETICQVLSAELGIYLSHAGIDECDQEAVFFEPLYPWEYSQKERGLTRESLEELLEPYAKELGCIVEDIELVFYG